MVKPQDEGFSETRDPKVRAKGVSALTGGKARAQNVISCDKLKISPKNRKYCPETEFPLSFSKGNLVP
jgi:hypothetical protein